MAEISKTSPPDRASAASPPPPSLQELPAKGDAVGDADRVKGGTAGVKKTMSTQ